MDINFKEIDKRLTELKIKDKDSESRKIWESVLDERTVATLFKLSKRGLISAVGGPISTGKEANLFYGYGGNNREIAIKIYRIETGDFRDMYEYIIGDPRFERVKKSRDDLIYLWTKKEHKNLKRAFENGVRVPEPIASMNNILLMEFIGKNEKPAPKIKDAGLNERELEESFKKIIDYMKILYQDAKLVHADLSEYNVLYYDGPVLIDMGQAVLNSHFNAIKFLRRDIKNIIRFFNESGLVNSVEEEELLKMIIGEIGE